MSLTIHVILKMSLVFLNSKVRTVVLCRNRWSHKELDPGRGILYVEEPTAHVHVGGGACAFAHVHATSTSFGTVGQLLLGPAVARDTDSLFWALPPDCQGIVEDVILLGAPVEGEAKHWEPFRKVVSGRIINGYCRSVPTLHQWGGDNTY